MNIRNRKRNSTKKTSTKMSARTSTENKPSIQTKVPLTGAERPKCQTEGKKCIAGMTTTTTTTATRQGCQLTTIIFILSVFWNITTPSTTTRSYRWSRGWRKRMRCYRTRWQGWGRWGKITDWKITGRTSRIWNRELMNINSGWEAIHKINIKI